MKNEIEKLIGQAEADYAEAVKGKARGDVPASARFLGSAISGLKGVRDNLKWAEDAKAKESKAPAPTAK